MADTAWKAHERAVGVAFSRWIAQTPKGKKPPAIIARQALQGRMVERLWGDLALHPDVTPKWMSSASWFMNWVMVDAKRRKVFSLPALLRSPSHAMFEWWAKLDEQCPSDRMRFMVLMDRGARLLVYGRREAKVIHDATGNLPFPSYQFRAQDDAHLDEPLTICHLDAFVRDIEPDAFGCPGLTETKPNPKKETA